MGPPPEARDTGFAEIDQLRAERNKWREQESKLLTMNRDYLIGGLFLIYWLPIAAIVFMFLKLTSGDETMSLVFNIIGLLAAALYGGMWHGIAAEFETLFRWVSLALALVAMCALWVPLQLWWQRSVPEDDGDPGMNHGCACGGQCSGEKTSPTQ